MNDFKLKPFYCKVGYSNDELIVSKGSCSEWVDLEMITNGIINGKITLREKEMVEQLKFILSQLLD
jgi:hypothetical protein